MTLTFDVINHWTLNGSDKINILKELLSKSVVSIVLDLSMNLVSTAIIIREITITFFLHRHKKVTLKSVCKPDKNAIWNLISDFISHGNINYITKQSTSYGSTQLVTCKLTCNKQLLVYKCFDY